MKKKQYILISGIIVSLGIAYFIFNKLKKPTLKNIINVLENIKKTYGIEIAKNVERIYRLETDNFKSGQFLETYSPGMMAFSLSYPFGWNSMAQNFWNMKTKFKPIGIAEFKENPGLSGTGGGIQKFIKFPSLNAAMNTLAYFLSRHNNNPGRWYSTNENEQYSYNEKIKTIKTNLV